VSEPRPNDRFGLLAKGVRRDMSEKGWAPLRYWVLWWTAISLAVVLFYVLLTPIWLGLRWAAWASDLRSRVRR
jgi:hypothetical protein